MVVLGIAPKRYESTRLSRSRRDSEQLSGILCVVGDAGRSYPMKGEINSTFKRNLCGSYGYMPNSIFCY